MHNIKCVKIGVLNVQRCKMSNDTCIKTFSTGEVGIPGGNSLRISPSTPIYSSYTGEIIGYGCIQYNTSTDVATGNGVGKVYHAVECNPITGTCLAH
jgi:hypothetical protein